MGCKCKRVTLPCVRVRRSYVYLLHSPKRQKRGILDPTTPLMTGPLCMPTRIITGPPVGRFTLRASRSMACGGGSGGGGISNDMSDGSGSSSSSTNSAVSGAVWALCVVFAVQGTKDRRLPWMS